MSVDPQGVYIVSTKVWHKAEWASTDLLGYAKSVEYKGVLYITACKQHKLPNTVHCVEYLPRKKQCQNPGCA